MIRPVEVDPYKPPTAPVQDSATPDELDKLRPLVQAYRALVRWVGVQLLLTFGGAVAIGAMTGSPLAVALAWVRFALLLVTVVPLVIYAYRTSVALGSKAGVVWGLAMLFPLINLITLLILSSRATRACQAAGIPVGFFGPKVIRRAGTTVQSAR